MNEGIIALFQAVKQWGFIRQDDGTEIFFHLVNSKPTFVPKLGARVKFDIVPPLKLGQKDQAANIEVVS